MIISIAQIKSAFGGVTRGIQSLEDLVHGAKLLSLQTAIFYFLLL